MRWAWARASPTLASRIGPKAPTNSWIFDYSFMNLLFDEENGSQIFIGGASRWLTIHATFTAVHVHSRVAMWGLSHASSKSWWLPVLVPHVSLKCGSFSTKVEIKLFQANLAYHGGTNSMKEHLKQKHPAEDPLEDSKRPACKQAKIDVFYKVPCLFTWAVRCNQLDNGGFWSDSEAMELTWLDWIHSPHWQHS